MLEQKKSIIKNFLILTILFFICFLFVGCTSDNPDFGSIEQTQTLSSADINEYIGNRNSLIFHIEECTYLPATHNRVYFDSVEDAVEAGYRACKVCTP